MREPLWIPLPVPARRPLLACGAGLGSTFCIAEGAEAHVFAHGGTPDQLEAEIARRVLELGVEPEVIVCDAHPAYASSRIGHSRPAATRVEVQHHHAHLAAVLAEHLPGTDVEEPAVGVIHDDGGFGTDGTVWGGELLAGGLGPTERVGLLFPVRLPGGEVMAHERWRMVCSWLIAAGGEDPPGVPVPLAGSISRERWEAVAAMARTGTASPLTTSVGRLLGAVDALTGRASGRAGLPSDELLAAEAPRAYPLPLIEEGVAPVILDARETVRALLADLEAGVDPAVARARVVLGLADGSARAASRAADRAGAEAVVLAGDTFDAWPLLAPTADRLRSEGLRVLTPKRLPSGDAAISFGQAAVAAWADDHRS